MDSYYTQPWFQYVSSSLQALIKQAFYLLDREQANSETQPDYAFVVFPLAKAYEGFLKQFLFDLNLITPEQFSGRKFRIGRALNPDVKEYQRDDAWLYDDVVRGCGEPVAREIWAAWLSGRNQLFHYFPSAYRTISLEQAEKLVYQLCQAMAVAIACELPPHRQP